MTDPNTIEPTEHATLGTVDGDGRSQLFQGEPKTIELSLSAGEQIPAHTHPDRQIVFYVLSGQFSVTVGDESHDVGTGELLRFDGTQDISPKAIVDSTALLVLAHHNK